MQRRKMARYGKIYFWIGRRKAYFWIARVGRQYYVYCKVKEEDGRYRTYYVAPLKDFLRKLGIPAEMAAREMKRIKKLIDDVKARIREVQKINEKPPAALSDINLNLLVIIVVLDVLHGGCDNVAGCSTIMAAMWNFVKDMEKLARQRSDLYISLKLFELRQALVDALKRAAQQYQ